MTIAYTMEEILPQFIPRLKMIISMGITGLVWLRYIREVNFGGQIIVNTNSQTGVMEVRSYEFSQMFGIIY